MALRLRESRDSEPRGQSTTLLGACAEVRRRVIVNAERILAVEVRMRGPEERRARRQNVPVQ